MTFFFLEITFKLDKNDEKIFGIFTLSLERSHYFRRGENLEGTLNMTLFTFRDGTNSTNLIFYSLD